MKLLLKKPEKLIRVNITQPGQVARHLSFYDCTLSECFNSLMSLVEQNIDGEHKAMLQCREWYNSTNGASMSFSFNADNLDGVEQLIINHFS
jgi:hypothetical protein